MSISDVIKKIASCCGYRVRKLQSCSETRKNLYDSYLHLRNMGFKPATIIDVGVAKGTFELYRNFPEAYFLLIEPLQEFEHYLKEILKQYRGKYVLAAAGASEEQVTFNIHDTHLEGSSLYKETLGSCADGYEIKVPMLKLDSIIETENLSGPFLLKIDVQGAELEVLNGSQLTLLETEVVALEVSLFEFLHTAPQFHDVVFYMKQRGFVAYDLVLGWNRPLDNALGQVDIVFVKEHGPFRQSHAYSTPEQFDTLFNK